MSLLKFVAQRMNVRQLGKYAKYTKLDTVKPPPGSVPSKYAKYAKSITVKAPESGVSFPIEVTAVYKGNTVEDESVSVTLTQNGQSHTFPKRTEYMGTQHWGTWTSDMPIHIIKGTINGTGKVFEAKPKEYCNDVVQNLEFIIEPEHEPEHIKMITENVLQRTSFG